MKSTVFSIGSSTAKTVKVDPAPPAGWETYHRSDGTPYFYHAATGTTAWDFRALPPAPAGRLAPLPPILSSIEQRQSPVIHRAAPIHSSVISRRIADVHVVKLETLPHQSTIPKSETIASAQPDLSWVSADWDLILVLPMDYDADDHRAEHVLRQALQLADSDEAADGSGHGRCSSAAWLASELRRRVLAAGLGCKVLKLLPEADAAAEQAGELEIRSSNRCMLLCVGSIKTIFHAKPPPPPLGRQRTPAQLRAHRERLRQAERFPRLEQEAQHRKLRLRNLKGVFTKYRMASAAVFPAFQSATRQRLLQAVLEAPVAEGGAGVNLSKLKLCGRMLELVHVHDDDEVSAIRDRFLVKSCAGVLPLRSSTLLAMHSYSGAQLTLYFAWVSMYTRLLWLPALVGLALFLSDRFYYDSRLQANVTANVTEVENGQGAHAVHEQAIDRFNRAMLMAGFGLFIIVWGALFEELWKRRAATLATEWGEASSASGQPSVINSKFKALGVREGFYTEEQLFVTLDQQTDAEWKRDQRWQERARRSARVEDAAVPPAITDESAAAPTYTTLDTAVSTLATDTTAASSAHPRDQYFPLRMRRRRQTRSYVILALMGLACIVCIFLMQFFSALLQEHSDRVGGQGGLIYSVANALMIIVFNTLWRTIALWLTTLENYRLEFNFGTHLTIKLFTFQCINCYFQPIYICFLKPFGIRLFGIELHRCYTESARPEWADENVRQCSEELRALLLSILLVNIAIGQLTEVLTVALGNKGLKDDVLARLCCCCKRKKRPDQTNPSEGPLDLDELARAARKRKREMGRVNTNTGSVTLEPEEQLRQDELSKMLDVIAEYERAPPKSEEGGLGATFYEYNELVIQYGYVLMFSIVLPIAPLLALANNLIEVRTDAFKLLFVARRIPAQAARDIGPWRVAIKALSYAAILVNLLYLMVTTDFFEQLAVHLPMLRAELAQWVCVLVAVKVLIFARALIDICVPDVPDRVKVSVAREKYLASRAAKELAAEAEGAGATSSAGCKPTVPEIIRAAPPLPKAIRIRYDAASASRVFVAEPEMPVGRTQDPGTTSL